MVFTYEVEVYRSITNVLEQLRFARTAQLSYGKGKGVNF